MSRIKYLLLIIITAFIFPVVVNAAGSVEISNVVEQERHGNAFVINQPTYRGLTINNNIAFDIEGDYVTFKATIRNSTEDNYKIESNNTTSETGYVTYSFEFPDNSNVVKAHSLKDVLITIKYVHAVPADRLVNGDYTETSRVPITLKNTSNRIVNPKTTTTYGLVIAIGIVALLGFSIFLYRKNRKAGSLLLLVTLIAPVATYAVQSLTVEFNTRIEVDKDPKFCVIAPSKAQYDSPNGGAIPGMKVAKTSEEATHYYTFTRGMTLSTWKTSSLYDSSFQALEDVTIFASHTTIKCYDRVAAKYPTISTEEDLNRYVQELGQCDSEYGVETNLNLPLKSRIEGCYLYDFRY